MSYRPSQRNPMQPGIGPLDTLSFVASAKGLRDDSRIYDEKAAEHARRALRRFVDETGGQASAAKALGTKQPTLSRNMSAAKQPPLWLLITLSRVTGRTINDILGLETASQPASPLPSEVTDEIARKVSDLLRPELAARAPGSILAAPTAFEFAARDPGKWSRELGAAMKVEHGEERKAPEEWLPLFRAKKKVLAQQRDFRKKHAEKRAAERPPPHRGPHKATG